MGTDQWKLDEPDILGSYEPKAYLDFKGLLYWFSPTVLSESHGFSSIYMYRMEKQTQCYFI